MLVEVGEPCIVRTAHASLLQLTEILSPIDWFWISKIISKCTRGSEDFARAGLSLEVDDGVVKCCWMSMTRDGHRLIKFDEEGKKGRELSRGKIIRRDTNTNTNGIETERRIVA